MSGTRRLIFIIVFGGGGLAVLLTLGFWQVDRLAWKRGLNAEIAARSQGAPVSVMGDEAAEKDDHRSAQATGRFLPSPPQIRYLTSLKGLGPGFRLIAPFELENGQRILVDRGYAPETVAPRSAPAPALDLRKTTVRGVLRWPDEASSFTPAPNLTDRIWFAREVASMSEALETRPVLLVRAPDGPQPDGTIEWPAPIFEKVALPNNHLGYAVTWFALAAIWFGMSVLWVFRTRD